MAVVAKDANYSIHEIYSKAIHYQTFPRKYLDQLLLLFEEDHESFSISLQNILLIALPHYITNSQAHKVLKITRSLFTELKKELQSHDSHKKSSKISQLITKSLTFILMGLDSKSKPCRLGCITLLDSIISLSFYELLPIPTLIQTSVLNKLKFLLRDKSSSIRAIAIKLAENLKLTEEILKFCINDPHKHNRIAAIKSSLPNLRNIKGISGKLFDIEYEIRFEALKKLMDFGIQNLDLHTRREILFISVKDRYEPMRNYSLNSLKNIIKQIGIEELLKLVEVELLDIKQQKDINTCLRVLCNSFEVTELEKLIHEKLLKKVLEKAEDFSGLLLARICIESLHSKNESVLYKILPTSEIISLLEHFHPSYPFFFTQSVLKICYCLEIQEEWIRKSLISSLISLCLNYKISIPSEKKNSQKENTYFKLLSDSYFADNSLEVVKLAVELLRALLDQHFHEFPRIMGEILNEIRDPLTFHESSSSPSLLHHQKSLIRQVSAIDEEIDALESEKELLLAKGEYSSIFVIRQEISRKAEAAQAYESELISIESEILNRYYRALAITTEMLREIKHGVLTIDISEFIEQLIMPALQFNQEPVQIVAFECLAQCCLHDSEVCKACLHLFTTVLQKHSDSMLEFIALVSVCDIFLVWDFKCNTLENEGNAGEGILGLLIKYAHSEDWCIKAVAIEGITKMVMLDRVHSSSVLAYLMIPYFDKDSPAIIKQILQVFFQKFSTLRLVNCETLGNAFKMVLSLLCSHLEKTQSIETIDFSYFNMNRVFGFIWNCLSSEYIKENSGESAGYNYHMDVFFFFSQEIIRKNSCIRSEIYSRFLLQIDVSGFTLEELVICKKMLVTAVRIVESNCVKAVIEKVCEGIKKYSQRTVDCEALENVLMGKYLNSLKLVKGFLKHYMGWKEQGVRDGKKVNTLKYKRKSPYKLGSEGKKIKFTV